MNRYLTYWGIFIVISILAYVVVSQSVKNDIPNSLTLMVELLVGVSIAILFYVKSEKLTKDIEEQQNRLLIRKKESTINILFSLTMKIGRNVANIKEQIKENNSSMKHNIELHVTLAEGNISNFEMILSSNFEDISMELIKILEDYDEFLHHIPQVKVHLNNLRLQPDMNMAQNLDSILTIMQMILIAIVKNTPKFEPKFRKKFPNTTSLFD